MISKLQRIEYHPKFELLRGVAAIIVLIVHAIQLYWFRLIGSSNEIAFISGLFGRHAVLLFFLLSGYLITLSILTNIIKNKGFDWTEYAAARIARIYPPLIGAIILVLIAWFIIKFFHLPGYTHYGIATDKYIARERFEISWSDVKRTLLMANGFLQANGPLWSLYIEWHLYVIAMFFTIAIIAKSNLHRILSGLAIGFFFIYGNKINEEFLFYSIIWFLGGMSAVAVSFGKRHKIANLTTFIILFIVLCIYFLYFYVSDAINIKNTFFNHLAQILFCILYLQIVVFSEIIEKFNIPNWAVSSGANSYSLYVIHFPLLLLTYSITQNWMMDSYLKTWAVSIIALPSVYLFSVLFSSFFENQKLFKPAVRAFIRWAEVDILRDK